LKGIYETNFEGMGLIKRGKVRDIYNAGDYLIIVATDRLSAFDCIFPNPIPCKGAVLTQISLYWFEQLKGIIPNHIVSCNPEDYGESAKPYIADLRGRSMMAAKANPFAIECVVRGYLHGSAWKEYQRQRTVCGIKLPAGLREKDPLPEFVFTPSTKAESGHDENISFERTCDIVGRETAEFLRDKSLEIFRFAHAQLRERGFTLVDTKFEFGLYKDEIILIDECITPDSSRIYLTESYYPGAVSVNFDKQFVRDYLEKTGWDKTPPAPQLPPDIIKGTAERYLQAYKIITGKDFSC